jgi:uncharacterized membrane protein (DUF106 family)
MHDAKLMTEIHDWLLKESNARVRDARKNPTLENLKRLQEIKARYKVEIRNLDKLIQETE